MERGLACFYFPNMPDPTDTSTEARLPKRHQDIPNSRPAIYPRAAPSSRVWPAGGQPAKPTAWLLSVNKTCRRAGDRAIGTWDPSPSLGREVGALTDLQELVLREPIPL